MSQKLIEVVEAELNTTIGRVDLGFITILCGVLASSGIKLKLQSGPNLLFQTSSPPLGHFVFVVLLAAASLVITAYYHNKKSTDGITTNASENKSSGILDEASENREDTDTKTVSQNTGEERELEYENN